MELFQREQLSTEVSLLQLTAGAHPPRRKKKAVERDGKIKKLKQKFINNCISLDDCVKGMSEHINI